MKRRADYILEKLNINNNSQENVLSNIEVAMNVQDRNINITDSDSVNNITDKENIVAASPPPDFFMDKNIIRAQTIEETDNLHHGLVPSNQMDLSENSQSSSSSSSSSSTRSSSTSSSSSSSSSSKTDQLNVLYSTDAVDWRCRSCIGSAKPKRLSCILPDVDDEDITDTENLMDTNITQRILSDIRREVRDIIKEELQSTLQFYSDKIDESMLKNFSQLEYIIMNCPQTIHLVIITEANISDRTKSLFELVNYEMNTQLRDSRKGGGVIVYVHKSICFTRLFSSSLSSMIATDKGTAQGSILGPTEYLLYVNDMCNIFTEGSVYQFADDTCLVAAHRDIREAQRVIQCNFDLLST
ncbi:hypothetical protein PYW08_009461 [Mythimna loreyi]|uniref:Uncharacterized protein n=1 Tax=Mythimna loreyi TaxID=667449 RepID=A0ACC2Q6F7_9NEOP|nr:hypothetical protein PYW08_009461 [Mythimna loreyi]